MYTIVDDDQRITQTEINDNEIPVMLDSGFVAGVLRINNGIIEFADVDWDTYTVNWTVPEIVNYD